MRQNLSTDEMEAKLGARLRAARLRKNLSQAEVAERAGVAVNALRALESGQGARVSTLVRVVRALDKLDWLDWLQPEVSISPMQLLKSKVERQRAGRPHGRRDQSPSSKDAG
ncbi:MAG: helix-turn-helix domain-containing protein [Burkholderiales bacterium]